MTSERTAKALNRDAASQQSGAASEKQSAARAALEARPGRTLSDDLLRSSTASAVAGNSN